MFWGVPGFETVRMLISLGFNDLTVWINCVFLDWLYRVGVPGTQNRNCKTDNLNFRINI